MGRTPSTLALAASVLGLALAGCGGGGGGRPTSSAGTSATGPAPAPAAGRIVLVSPAFPANGAIPAQFTCAGGGAAPPLRWSRLPPDTRTLALVVEDLDAPGGTFVHWILYDIPSTTTGLDGATPPPGAREARNSESSTGWTPPCPPPGDKVHRYVFTLYALRAPLGLPPNGDPTEVRTSIGRAAIAQGQLVGRFGR